MSAILLLGMGLLKAGDHVVCSRSVFGSTVMLFGREFAKFGVETTFVSQTDVAEWRAAIRTEHQAAVRRIADQPAHRGVRHPRPRRDRARRGRRSRRRQLLLHAGAAAADRARCRLRHPLGNQVPRRPGPRHRRCDLRERERSSTTSSSRCMRSAGMALSPFNAWVVLKGLETLSIRMQAQSARALALAHWLETQPAVERVYYPAPRVASAACARDGTAVGLGRRGRLASSSRSRDGSAAGARKSAFHVIDSDAHLLDHRQPRRHQDDDHASGEHVARASDRGAAPGRRHHAGHDPGRGRPRRCRRHQGRPRCAAWRRCERPHAAPRSPSGSAFARASRRRRPDFSTSARRARRSSPGRSRATTAASSCCASRTPTSRARRTNRSSRSSTSMRWLGLDYDEGPALPDAAARALPRGRRAAAGGGQCLPLLRDAGRARGDARGAARARREDRSTTGAGVPSRARRCRRFPTASRR